ncbi:MAG: hypothetical protein ACREJU_12765 [Nitrospiraceae bacterium]
MTMRKTQIVLSVLALGLLSFPAVSLSEQQQVTGQKSVAFPQSDKCTANSPCRNITGEITRIEESYWIKLADGREAHLKVSKDTKMEGLPKVGDSIAAQLTSTGDADAIVKLKDLPKPMQMETPSQSHQELR